MLGIRGRLLLFRGSCAGKSKEFNRDDCRGVAEFANKIPPRTQKRLARFPTAVTTFLLASRDTTPAGSICAIICLPAYRRMLYAFPCSPSALDFCWLDFLRCPVQRCVCRS